MSKKIKQKLVRILSALGVFLIGAIINAVLPQNLWYIPLSVFLISYLTAGYDVLLNTIDVLKLKMLLDENFLMSIATISAFVIGEWAEGVAVMVFYQIGELFSDIAVARSRKSQKELINLRPSFANLEIEGKIKKVSPEEIRIGNIIVVNPGEKISVDGEIISGASAIDVSEVLGEAIYEEAVVGDRVLSGSTAKNGTIKIKATTDYKNSTVAKIISLSQIASAKKTKVEKFTSRFARVYTPIVVVLAVLLCIVPTIFLGGFTEWFYRALMFLVVSCPCALVVSVPLSFFSAMGGASKCGILFKGSTVIEALTKVDTVCFDKTGTLTDGSFTIKEIVSNSINLEDFKALAGAIEMSSNHPIAMSIYQAFSSGNYTVQEHQNFSGEGVLSVIDGKRYYAGTSRFLTRLNIEHESVGDAVYIASEEGFLGYIIIGDAVKSNASTAVAGLKKLGVKNVVMLTGAAKNSAEDTAKAVGISEYYTKLLPEQKLKYVEKLLQEGKTVAYIGDGINDVPCLSLANVGVSMGVMGTDSAIEASDMVLMKDDLKAFNSAIKIAKKTMSVAKVNIILSILIKVAVMVLCAFGIAGMWHAVFADVGVCILAVLNSIRLLSTKKYR